MRRRPQREVRYLVLVSLTLAAFGMEVDVCSGPLPPQEGLALLLGAVSSDPQSDASAPDSANAGSCDGSKSAPDGRGPQQKQPRKLVSAAEWPVPVLLLKCRNQVKRNVTLAPSGVEAPSSSAAGNPPGACDVSLASHFYLSDHLCRLNC